MNRILFDTLTFINGFLAVIAIGLGALVGWNMPLFAALKPIGLLLGAGVGLTFAALICGTLAYFALMERHRRRIADSIASSAPGHQPFSSSPLSGRQEPTL